MSDPNSKIELEPTAALANPAELSDDFAVLMFLNDPRHSPETLSSVLADYVPDADAAADAILERRAETGAFVQWSGLAGIDALNRESLSALMQSGLRPEWLEKSLPSTSIKVSLAYLSTIIAGALWWGPLLPSFKWGNNPWLGGSVGDLGFCYELKQSIYAKRIKPFENEVKTLKAKLTKLKNKPQSAPTDKQIAAVEKTLTKAEKKLEEELKPLQKLKDFADAGEKEHAWWIIRSNVLKYIKQKEKELARQKLLKAKALNESNQEEANKAQEIITSLEETISSWGKSVTATDLKVTAKKPPN